MSTDPNLLTPTLAALIIAIVIAFFTATVGFLKYVVSVWAIRTSKSPAERKAQTEVAGRAVSSSPLKGLIKLPGPKEDDGPE